MSHLSISVIIPYYKQFESVQHTLSALNQKTLPVDKFQVIVIDDGSEDVIEDILKKRILSFPAVLLPEKNLGASAAHNLGAQNSISNILLY